MKFTSALVAALTGGLLLGAATASQAAVYDLDFVDLSSTFTVDAQITTLDVLNGVGGYDIVGITGTVSGNPGVDPITGLIANPTPPVTATCCGFFYDNVFFLPGPGFLNTGGVLFTTAGGTYNLFMDSPTDGRLYTYGAPDPLDVHGTITALAVPEPGTWALMLLGFAGAGVALRNRRTERVQA